MTHSKNRVKNSISLPYLIFLAAIGMKVKGKLSSGGVLVVSGSAGATGSVAGQIGKILGAKKVIGICGTDEKCNFIKEIGFTHSVRSGPIFSYFTK